MMKSSLGVLTYHSSVIMHHGIRPRFFGNLRPNPHPANFKQTKTHCLPLVILTFLELSNTNDSDLQIPTGPNDTLQKLGPSLSPERDPTFLFLRLKHQILRKSRRQPLNRLIANGHYTFLAQSDQHRLLCAFRTLRRGQLSSTHQITYRIPQVHQALAVSFP